MTRLLSMADLSEWLGGTSPSSIYRYIKTVPGFPQPVKVGRATRFKAEEVNAYIGSLAPADATSAQPGEGGFRDRHSQCRANHAPSTNKAGGAS